MTAFYVNRGIELHDTREFLAWEVVAFAPAIHVAAHMVCSVGTGGGADPRVHPPYRSALDEHMGSTAVKTLDGVFFHDGVDYDGALLRATKNRALDEGISCNKHLSLFRSGDPIPNCRGGQSHTAAKHVAANRFLYGLMVVTDGATANVDGDVTVVYSLILFGLRVVFNVMLHPAVQRVCNHLSRILRVFNLNIYQVSAHRTVTASAIDGAQHGTTTNVDLDVSTHSSSGEGFGVEATASTENIAVNIGITYGANSGLVAYIDIDITNDVAFLSATKQRTVYDAVRHLHVGVSHVSPCVEIDTRVAFTRTIKVACDRMFLDLLIGTRNTQSAARHDDSRITT